MAQIVKNLPASRRPQFDPWIEKIWRREWLSTPVFLPGEFYGQRSLAGYSPCGHKELDVSERLTLTFLDFLLLCLSDVNPQENYKSNESLCGRRVEGQRG